MLKLYGMGIIKLKPHIQHHVPDSMEEWDLVANCFSAERAHKVPKAFGHHCKRGGRQYMVGVLNRSVNMIFASIDKTPLQPIYLESCAPMPSLRTALQHLRPDLGFDTRASRFISTEYGRFKSKDLVLIKECTGDAFVAEAIFFASNSLECMSENLYAVCYTRYVKVGEGTWAATEKVDMCNASCLRAALPFKLAGVDRLILKPIFPRIPGLRV